MQGVFLSRHLDRLPEANLVFRILQSSDSPANPGIKYDAGHYIPAGSCTALRFNPRNVHKQCSIQCNLHKSGNRVNYRFFLIRKYGQEVVDELEGPQPTIKPTVEWYREIETKYKALCRELENET